MGDNLELRLIRLERLMDDQLGLGAAEVEAREGDSVDAEAVTRLRATAQRLHAFTAELGKREGSAEWDGADAIAARIVLTDLSQALRACRTLRGTIETRLSRLLETVCDAKALVERESTHLGMDADGTATSPSGERA